MVPGTPRPDHSAPGARHPLLDVLLDAAHGVFPPADGTVAFMPDLPDGNRAIVALTGHAIIAADVSEVDFDGIELDGFGAALAPSAVLQVAEGGMIGCNDVILVAPGTGRGVATPSTTAWDDHPRVVRTQGLRTEVTVYGDAAGFFTLAKGLAGRNEMSIEIADATTSTGLGRRLIADALGGVAAGEFLFAGVSPGNARSLRSFLAAGFVPIGSEVIIDRSSQRSSAVSTARA